MSKVIHFKNRNNYMRYLKWGYSHDLSGRIIVNPSMRSKNVFKATPGKATIYINGKKLKRRSKK